MNLRGAGTAFVACFVIAAIVHGSGAGSDAASVSAYYTHHADRQVAGCAFLLAFVIRAATGDLLAVVSGAAATVLLAIGNAL